MIPQDLNVLRFRYDIKTKILLSQNWDIVKWDVKMLRYLNIEMTICQGQRSGFQVTATEQKNNNSLKSFSIITNNIMFEALNTVFLDEIWKKFLKHFFGVHVQSNCNDDYTSKKTGLSLGLFACRLTNTITTLPIKRQDGFYDCLPVGWPGNRIDVPTTIIT